MVDDAIARVKFYTQASILTRSERGRRWQQKIKSPRNRKERKEAEGREGEKKKKTEAKKRKRMAISKRWTSENIAQNRT